jgi:hypothetical protein
VQDNRKIFWFVLVYWERVKRGGESDFCSEREMNLSHPKKQSQHSSYTFPKGGFGVFPRRVPWASALERSECNTLKKCPATSRGKKATRGSVSGGSWGLVLRALTSSFAHSYIISGKKRKS